MTSQSREFTGKKVLITGAAGVFGRWIAQAFAEQGAKLFLSDIRLHELRQVSERLGAHGSVLIHGTDLRSRESIDELVEQVRREWRAPDILINNAGIYPGKMLQEMNIQDWSAVLEVNLTAPFLITKSIVQLMLDTGVAGSIVNMSSGAAASTWRGAGHYSVSKAGLEMLTRAFALEFAERGIRVNAVRPGFAPGSEVSKLSETYSQAMAESIPLGRTSGPHDVPDLILFLCSDKASYITGSVFAVDGGRSAGTLAIPPMGL